MTTSRRTLLKNSAAAAAALSFDWTRAQAQAETVRIGLIYDLTGPFAAGGSVGFRTSVIESRIWSLIGGGGLSTEYSVLSRQSSVVSCQ